MSIPFIVRDPTQKEFERFRLILSTYQDGSGQQALTDEQTLPGWRDFERSISIAFGGEAQENKFIFDVLIPDTTRDNIYFGVSCKMRRTLNDTKRNGRVTLELSNSSGKFWQRLGDLGIHQRNYKNKPAEVAKALLDQEKEWHEEVGLKQGGVVDLSRSFYLALSWNAQGEYQLFKFSLSLPRVSSLKWDFPSVTDNGKERSGRRLRGQDKQGTLIEWYGESGGQLKYYPLVKNALWKSEIFHLEPLPVNWNEKHGILAKAKDYFPDRWNSLE
ncbi:MAG: hypothetical protein HFACDABA_00540 [Anaerolineales bacterium]|nr:hypothetical protein [Anaerolineales bacterium]